MPAILFGGFWAAEASALQRSLVAALTSREQVARVPVPADLRISRGAGDLLVVTWRNMIVGFVPQDEAPLLGPQLPPGRRDELEVTGVVDHSTGLWRVWVGTPPEGGFPLPGSELDTLPPPEDLVAGGFPLRRSARR
ncbi:hypothetical protein [Cellulomonas massiliensis]|uniref:hypothetical protein n=1 Tax=Cellulomonas massiliensis TaxID=1465811 RepID=UPI000474CA3D|nr:hypothetical protein [Cellulomonas massiliensis]